MWVYKLLASSERSEMRKKERDDERQIIQKRNEEEMRDTKRKL